MSYENATPGACDRVEGQDKNHSLLSQNNPQTASTSTETTACKPRTGRVRGTGKTGRVNRTTAQLAQLKESLIALVHDYGRATTIRHIYYLAVTAGIGPKCDGFYQDIIRLLGEARRAGELAFHWIVDNTRSVSEPLTFTGIPEALDWLTYQYELSYWDQPEADCQVQIWCEADTVSHIIKEVTFKYAVPFFCARGASSITFIHEDAANRIEADGRPAYVYWFGDYDKPGLEIFEACKKDLEEWTPSTPVRIERVAVTQEQIDRYGLLMHDCKPQHLSKWYAKTGQAEVCELDAMDSDDLRALVEAVIVQHVDMETFKRMKVHEASEKLSLGNFAAKWGQS